MNVSDIMRLFDHGYWANATLFEIVERLTEEELGRTVDGTHGSVGRTLVHMLSAEWIWLGRFVGRERGGQLRAEDFASASAIIERWKEQEREMRAFLATLGDEDLKRTIEFVIGGKTKIARPLGELLQQAALHGVHHRGQVSLLLRLMGYEPENFDLVLYDMARG